MALGQHLTSTGTDGSHTTGTQSLMVRIARALPRTCSGKLEHLRICPSADLIRRETLGGFWEMGHAVLYQELCSRLTLGWLSFQPWKQWRMSILNAVYLRCVAMEEKLLKTPTVRGVPHCGTLPSAPKRCVGWGSGWVQPTPAQSNLISSQCQKVGEEFFFLGWMGVRAERSPLSAWG